MDIFSDEEQKNESEENWRPKLSHMLLQHTMSHNYSNVNMSTECEEGRIVRCVRWNTEQNVGIVCQETNRDFYGCG